MCQSSVAALQQAWVGKFTIVKHNPGPNLRPHRQTSNARQTDRRKQSIASQCERAFQLNAVVVLPKVKRLERRKERNPLPTKKRADAKRGSRPPIGYAAGTELYDADDRRLDRGR